MMEAPICPRRKIRHASTPLPVVSAGNSLNLSAIWMRARARLSGIPCSLSHACHRNFVLRSSRTFFSFSPARRAYSTESLTAPTSAARSALIRAARASRSSGNSVTMRSGAATGSLLGQVEGTLAHAGVDDRVGAEEVSEGLARPERVGHGELIGGSPGHRLAGLAVVVVPVDDLAVEVVANVLGDGRRRLNADDEADAPTPALTDVAVEHGAGGILKSLPGVENVLGLVDDDEEAGSLLGITLPQSVDLPKQAAEEERVTATVPLCTGDADDDHATGPGNGTEVKHPVPDV